MVRMNQWCMFLKAIVRSHIVMPTIYIYMYILTSHGKQISRTLIVLVNFSQLNEIWLACRSEFKLGVLVKSKTCMLLTNIENTREIIS